VPKSPKPAKPVKSDLVSIYATEINFSTHIDTLFPDNNSRAEQDNSTVVDQGTNYFAGVQNPYWKTQVRNGQNATTVADGKRFDYSIARVTGHATATFPYGNDGGDYVQDTYNAVGRLNSIPNFYSPEPDQDTFEEVTNRAIRKFLDSCQAARSSIEGGQDLGEYKETLHGFEKPAAALQDYVFSYFPRLKKGLAERGSRSVAKVLSDTYLEWNFGWKPLVQDLADAYVGLQNAARHMPTVPVQGKATKHWTGDNIQILDGIGFAHVYYNYQRYGTYSVRIKGSMKTGATESGRLSKAQILGFTPERFVSTVWDLLPYSFIADYFVNIGDTIAAYSFPFADLSWGCYTSRSVGSARIGGAKMELPADVPGDRTFSGLVNQSGNSETTVTSFNRSPLTNSMLIPRFRFSLPTSNKPWYNMLAILVSRAVPFVSLLQKL
jgi:hypothetical protein